jgi:hypothetical protein
VPLVLSLCDFWSAAIPRRSWLFLSFEAEKERKSGYELPHSRERDLECVGGSSDAFRFAISRCLSSKLKEKRKAKAAEQSTAAVHTR